MDRMAFSGDGEEACQTSAPCRDRCAAEPSRSAASADRELVHIITGSVRSRGTSGRWSGAVRRAIISTVKLKHRDPAWVRSTCRFSSGKTIGAPAPPLITPPVADP